MSWNQKRPERPRRSLTGANPRPPDETPLVIDCPPQHAMGRSSRSFLKSPPARSGNYLDFVRSLSCCCCHAPAPSDPHHFGGKGESGGMGMKPDDRRTVPLCRGCHSSWHNTRAIGPMNRFEVEAWFYRVQVSQLLAWLDRLAEASARAKIPSGRRTQ